MPTAKPHHLDQFDIDIAMLGDPIADDALDAISSTIEAREAATELLAHLAHFQKMLEGGAPAYKTREQFAVDFEQLLERIGAGVSGLLG
jgi:hypothetical protein